MFYLFNDFNSGCKAIFDKKEALDSFMKDYGNAIYDLDESFPIRNQDYSITHLTEINPCYKAWDEGYEEEDE